MLCSSSGTCQPIRSLLNTGNNTVYWVDQAIGNDTNPGNEAQPFKTIQRAVETSTINPGDAVIIREGTYYGQVSPGKGGTSGNRITITSFPGDEVIVSGAINLTGTWTQDGSAWKLTWPHEALWHRFEGPNDLFGPARRRDVLIADDQMLQAVYTRADVKEGTFFLEGSPDNPSTMFAMLPGNKNPNNALMQTSLLNHLFNPSNNEPSCRFGNVKGYYHVIGITFRHTANDGQMGAVCAGNEGSILENITVEWTNGSGFLISGNNHVVRGVRANHNGMSGIRGNICDNCLVEYSESKYNNWKGYKPFWESGGGKWLYTSNSTFRNLDFSENEGPGLWLDMDNFDNVIEQNTFDSNLGANLFLEWTTDRTLVRNNVLTRARYAWGSFYGHGLLIHAANNNIVLHNTFMSNEGGGMRIRADDRDKATGNRYYNNLFIANTLIDWNSDRRSSEISFEEHANDSDARSNKGEGNVFWYRNYSTHEYNTFQYRVKGTSGGSVVRSSSLSEWQNKALTDYNSMTIQPAQPHVVDTTDHVSGWRLAAESQIIGKGVSLPSDLAPLLVDFDGEPRPVQAGDVGADQFTFGMEDPPPSGIAGDASGNGVVTALDASLILQHASGLLDLNGSLYADASGDGSVTAFDASLILQLITGYLTCLPADNSCVGKRY
ncbi:MAG: right-handed parallel beta-helix repeat-containing protein [Rhodothermales bacterium]